MDIRQNSWQRLTFRYIIAVVAVTNIGTGRIMPSDGSAKFQCEYTAVVMKPFKGEVVDGKVTIVNKVCFESPSHRAYAYVRWASSRWSALSRYSYRHM